MIANDGTLVRATRAATHAIERGCIRNISPLRLPRLIWRNGISAYDFGSVVGELTTDAESA